MQRGRGQLKRTESAPRQPLPPSKGLSKGSRSDDPSVSGEHPKRRYTPKGETRTQECVQCGRPIVVRASETRKQFCDRECYGAFFRQEDQRKAERERQRGKRNPKNAGSRNGRFKDGKRVGENDRVGIRRWQEYPLENCEDCGSRQAINRHHVVYRQHVRAEHGDEWDPDNALGLCGSCHPRHHHQKTKLPLIRLRPENIAFAFRLLGTGGYDYLRRRYAGEDPRLELALEQVELLDPATLTDPAAGTCGENEESGGPSA